MTRFSRLAGIIGSAAGSAQEQAEKCKWAVCDRIRKSIMFMKFKDLTESSGRMFQVWQMGHMIRDCPKLDTKKITGGKVAPPNTRGRVFALSSTDAANAQGTISGTLQLGEHSIYVLFDTGATHSIVSLSFTKYLPIRRTSVDPTLTISIPMENSIVITHIYGDCPIRIESVVCNTDLFPMHMSDFDVILGMDCCPKLVYQGIVPHKTLNIISALKARKFISHGCAGFLASIKDTSVIQKGIDSHPVVCEYPDVFPEELLGLPPDREIEFTIDLIPGAKPISKAPYRKANVVADALSRKSFGIVSCLQIHPRIIYDLDRLGVGIHVGDSNGYLARMQIEPDLISRNKDAQRLCVPDDSALRESLLPEAHNSPFSIHPGSTKMHRDLRQNFWWSRMKEDVAIYVSRCLTCQQVKIEHQRASGLMQPLEIPVWKWDEISMDFVTGFSNTFKKNDTIWEIIRLHGTPSSIVSDRDPRFTSRFWKGFQAAWGKRLKFSIAFHPQIDGQSERTIQTLEDLLRACALEWTGKWDEYLCLVEFAYNNSWQESIGMAPFELLYGRKCRAPICWEEVGENIIEGPELVQITNNKVVVAREKLKEAQSRQNSYADQRRRIVEFQVGDQVFLKVSPCRGVRRFGIKGKLSPCYIGPFEILERIGEVSYRLALPS
ncbi:uncharacterized protein LOC143616023 [Bidens hawaiensis]|uniref:uncharacterized protein LOC143616023 n=1 Tax=Bidens hawaiensis TaxID=980011 RepID=UPI0040492922